MNIQPHYVTFAQFGDMGLGHACDPTDFDIACDAYFNCREDGQDAAVFRVDPKDNGKAAMMVDVTADAEHYLTRNFSRQNMDAPAWLLEAA